MNHVYLVYVIYQTLKLDEVKNPKIIAIIIMPKRIKRIFAKPRLFMPLL